MQQFSPQSFQYLFCVSHGFCFAGDTYLITAAVYINVQRFFYFMEMRIVFAKQDKGKLVVFIYNMFLTDFTGYFLPLKKNEN
jgi:hypothetical protein